MLKDGNFQLVREYQVQGDRVRYYSLDSGQWEEMPEALVDWEATRKVAEKEAKDDQAVVQKVHTQEAARQIMPLDVDASLEAAPGVFIPPGEGLFVFDGKAILSLTQALANSETNKKRAIEQVLVPIPIVPSRSTVLIPGARAKLRVKAAQPEFYMRTADAREPEMELVRAKVHGGGREIENIDTIFKQHYSKRDSVRIQRWEVAHGVYRFTVEQSLAPGEYAMVEIVQGEGMNLYVWDIGVDSPGAAAGKAK